MAVLAIAAGAAACVAPVLPGAPAADGTQSIPAGPPPPALLEAHATLLRLEDRREDDGGTLRTLAGDSSARVRARAALTLGRLRSAHAASLLPALLADADTGVAASAAFALGLIGDSAHAELLADRLRGAVEGGQSTVASEAAYALGRIGGSLARTALGDLLRAGPGAELPTQVAASALLAVWRFDPPIEVQIPQAWLASEEPELRWRAAYALARRPRPEALPVLRSTLRDPDPRVRATALRGIDGALAGAEADDLAREVATLLADSTYQVAVSAARALGSFPGPTAVNGLVATLASTDPHLVLAAVDALGRLGASATAAGQALERLATSDAVMPALRAAAVEALAKVDVARGAAVATRLLVSPDWRLRAAAAGALLPADPARRELVRDADPRVANAALQALLDAPGASAGALRPILIEGLGSADAIVRATALGGLARAAEPADLPLVLDAYARAQDDTENDAALAAIDALAALSRPEFDPARAFLTRFPRPDDPLVRLRAAARLDPAAVERAWGTALPLETGRTSEDYRLLVEQLVAPGLADAAAPEALIVTRRDSIRVRLFAAEAPLTVENFLRLADAGYFDGQEWPRVVPDFVIQGGDPRGDTSGGPGYSIRDEIGRRRYGSGTVGMALAGPDTGGSQFFITHSPQPHLDGGYTIFGEVVAGGGLAQEILPGDTIQTIRSIR